MDQPNPFLVAILALGVVVFKEALFAAWKFRRAYYAADTTIAKREILWTAFYVMSCVIFLVTTTSLTCIWYHEYR